MSGSFSVAIPKRNQCRGVTGEQVFVVALSFDVGPGPLSIGIEVGKANPSIKSAGSRSKASVKDVFLVLSPKSASALPGVEVTVGGL